MFLLVPAVIAQIFSPIAELIIPIGTPNKEAKAEIEIHPVIAEAKIRKSFTTLFLLSTYQFILLYFFDGNDFLFRPYFSI